jgi:hypothetical protein
MSVRVGLEALKVRLQTVEIEDRDRRFDLVERPSDLPVQQLQCPPGTRARGDWLEAGGTERSRVGHRRRSLPAGYRVSGYLGGSRNRSTLTFDLSIEDISMSRFPRRSFFEVTATL